ncbi:MAG TPA: ATP-binding protein [Chthoniobacter sp.]
MNFIELFGKQPKAWILAESFVFLVLIVIVDVITSWQYTMFVFYCIPVFLVAMQVSRRLAFAFAVLTGFVAMAANYDSIPIRGLAGYIWSGANRTGGLLIAAAYGVSVQSFREEMRRRMQAMEHAQELEREIVRAGEREQIRIGQDLHDGVCQTLAALDCAAQCLKLDLEVEGSPQSKLATEIQKRLSAATLEARSLARGIYPLPMEPDGLGMALRELVMTTRTLCHAAIGFESDEDIVVRDSEVAMHLYRITQEALSNAMRHSNATRVDVRVMCDNQRLSICVVDDGCGSSLQGRSDGMGWRTMHYRARLIGAQIEKLSPASGGTTVRCSLPLQAAA